MSDPFAQYRKTPISPAPVSLAPAEYAAFDAKDRLARLKIRRTGDPTHMASYACLLNVTSDEAHGTHFALLFSYMIVIVRGRNLQSVAAAVAEGTAEFIQEFDSRRWSKPKDAQTPLIEDIGVFIQKNGSDMDKSELSFDPPSKGKVH